MVEKQHQFFDLVQRVLNQTLVSCEVFIAVERLRDVALLICRARKFENSTSGCGP